MNSVSRNNICNVELVQYICRSRALSCLYLHMNSLNIGRGLVDDGLFSFSHSLHISITTNVFVVRAVYFYTLHVFDLFLLYYIFFSFFTSSSSLSLFCFFCFILSRDSIRIRSSLSFETNYYLATASVTALCSSHTNRTHHIDWCHLKRSVVQRIAVNQDQHLLLLTSSSSFSTWFNINCCLLTRPDPFGVVNFLFLGAFFCSCFFWNFISH